MEDEPVDYASLSLDSMWSSEWPCFMHTPPDSICPILDEEYDEVESFDFNLEEATQDFDSLAGNWILGSPLPQVADFDSKWCGRSKWSEWSQWSEEDIMFLQSYGLIERNDEEQKGSSTWRNPQRIPGLLEDHQSIHGSHHDSRHEFQSGLEGACKRPKNICGLFIHVHVTHSEHRACERSQEQAQEAAREVKACSVLKTDRSSNSCPIRITKLKLRYAMDIAEKSAAAQNVDDEAQLTEVSDSSMAKMIQNGLSGRCSHIRCSTLGEPTSVQNQTEMHNKIRSWQSTLEFFKPGVLNDGEPSRNDAQVPNWNDEELSALLLSEIEELEGGYGHSTGDQGLWGRTPLGKKIEASIAAKGSAECLSSCPRLFHNGLVDSEMEDTCSDVEDDESQNFASSYSLEYGESSAIESSAPSDAEAESTGDSSTP